MSFLKELMATPVERSRVSRYSELNGILYLALGGTLIVWPGAVQTIFRDAPFAGHEGALFRVLGLTIAVIGWLYVFGGRSGARQFAPASVLDRLILVPVVLVPLILAGVFPHALGMFAILDLTLGIGAWVLLRREA